jgi:uncharacterized membrane protein YdbT with pleckstrin-like domain
MDIQPRASATAAQTAPLPEAFGTRLPVTLGPDPSLMKYYGVASLVFGPFFWIALIPLYFRYHTLRYEIDDEGISMRWGILFRKEVTLTYARIQDIHLTSNLVERWLGLARVQVQTASGSASAEMKIEGLPQFEALRDFLYARMRGARQRSGGAVEGEGGGVDPPGDTVAAILREVAREVRELRKELSPHGVRGSRA